MIDNMFLFSSSPATCLLSINVLLADIFLQARVQQYFVLILAGVNFLLLI